MKNQQLVNDVKFCKAFLGKSNLSILSNIHFDQNIMYCTNNEQSIKFRTELNVKTPFLIPAEDLEKIINKQKDFDVEINKRFNIILKNNSKVSLDINTRDIDNFPITENPENYFCTIDEKGIDRLKNIVYSAAQDTIKPVFNSICLQKTDQGVTAVSTDSRRLSMTKIAHDFEIEGKEIELLIPLKTIKLLLKLKPKNIVIRTNKDFETCSLCCDGRVEIISILCEGKYVNYKAVIPCSDEEKICVCNRKDFIKVLEQALTVGIAPAYKSIWNISKEKINVKIDTSMACFEGNIDNEGNFIDSMSIGINTKFVIETLKSIKSDKVNIFFSGEMSPVKIFDDHMTAIIMPIQLRSC